MFEQELVDCRLQGFLKNVIHSDIGLNQKLKVLANCCTYGERSFGVHLLSNGTNARIIGVRPCNHSWVCPNCTARQMARYASRIAAAIDAIKQLEDYVPIMITFTVFHTRKNSCDEVFELLTKTYTMFDKQASWKRRKKDGTYYQSGGAWCNFCNEFNIKHKVKAQEVTYGEHGWHCHMHNLYWVPRSRLQEVAEWEEKLLEHWRNCENRIAVKMFEPSEYVKRAEYYKNHDAIEEHHGLFISKDGEGKIREITSGDYACGWGGDKELTKSHVKTAREGHYTPMQLLQAAYDGDKACLAAFLELAETVIKRRQHRVDFSRTGINQIVARWRNTEGYKEYIKKKNISILQKCNITPYKTVCWFSKEQWDAISYRNDYSNPYLIWLIKRFALLPNAYELICELIEDLNIGKPLEKPPFDISAAYNDLIRYGRDDSEMQERWKVALATFAA